MTNSQLLFDAARALLCFTFVIPGIQKIRQFGNYIGDLESKNIPLPKVSLIIVIFIELFGGLCLLSGYLLETSAVVLFLFLIPTTLIYHKFWGLDVTDKETQMVHFLKNLGIMAALLLIIMQTI